MAKEFVIRDLRRDETLRRAKHARDLQFGADLLREALVRVRVAHERLHV